MISYVIAGDYSGWEVKSGPAGVVLQRGFKKIKLNKETLETYELIDEEYKKSMASGVTKGIVGGALLGGVGALAGIVSAKDTGVFQVAVQFRDGTRSLLKVDKHIYNRLVQDMF